MLITSEIKMKLIKFLLPILGLTICSFNTQADTAQGKLLQEKNCTRCHDNSVYTRANRQVNSLSALKGRVAGCEIPAGVKWTKQQAMDVVDYLNKEFYHFK